VNVEISIYSLPHTVIPAAELMLYLRGGAPPWDFPSAPSFALWGNSPGWTPASTSFKDITQ
jgi:hypothetical protein